MKRFLVVAIALFAFKASGQIAENMFFTEMVKRSHDSQSSILRVQGNLNFGSNGVDNVFASKMAFGGHIEKDRIKDIYTNMKTNGRVKTDLNYHLQFWSNDSLNSKKWNLYGGIGSRYYGQGSFNKDVFGILFRGNKPYAGTSLDLKNTDATVLQYMKYSIGVHREYQNKKGNLSSFTGASLSYIQGIDYLNFETKNTSLFTEASGQYVDLDLQYKLTRASRPKGFSHLQGHGVAIDAFYGKIEENYFWETSISDLGMVAFSNLISFEKDTTGVRFEGHKVSANGGSLGEVLDSIVEIVESNGEEVSETVFLPAIFNFRIGKKISKKLMADAILQHTFAQGNIPYLRARITKSNKNCTYGASLGLGGFEKSMNIGFHGTALLMGQVYLQAQVAGLESYFVPSFFQGLQASVGIGVLL